MWHAVLHVRLEANAGEDWRALRIHLEIAIRNGASLTGVLQEETSAQRLPRTKRKIKRPGASLRNYDIKIEARLAREGTRRADGGHCETRYTQSQ